MAASTLHGNLKKIRAGLPRLAEVLRLDAGAEIESWAKVLDTRLLTRFDPGFPLVVAVCGGGSTGKSTLFNALIGRSVSPTGGRAGMNRRVLFSIPEGFAAHAEFVAELLAPFAVGTAPLEDPRDLLVPGGPLHVTAPEGDGNLIVLDTPDFDTGAGGRYTNRQSAQGALEAADVLVYIFTNATYNNRDNTDFIARMLTGIGRRKCFLVYRCYPSFTDAEVSEHAMTAARHIYGNDAARYVLGVFRADEDNRVAAGEQMLALRPVPPDGQDLRAALAALDVAQVRFELHTSMVADVLEDAAGLLERCKASLEDLRRYEAALTAAQARGVQEALRYFPVDRVMRRFAKIWAASDPPAVKLMRRTGSLVELPLKAVLGAAGWARDRFGAGSPADPGTQFARKLEENLTTAATTLHHHVLSPHLQAPDAASPGGAGPTPVGGGGVFPVAVGAHPVVFAAQAQLQQSAVSDILKRILDRQRGDRQHRPGHRRGAAGAGRPLPQPDGSLGQGRADLLGVFKRVAGHRRRHLRALHRRPGGRGHHQGQAGRSARSERPLRPRGHPGHPQSQAGRPQAAQADAGPGRANLAQPQVQEGPGLVRSRTHGGEPEANGPGGGGRRAAHHRHRGVSQSGDGREGAVKTWERRAAVLRAAGRIETFKTDIGQLKSHLDAVPLWRPAAGLAKQCAEALRMIEEIAARLERSLVVVVIGPSGSGKSTLVNALTGGREVSPAGRERPTTGKLIVFGSGGEDAVELSRDLDPDSVEIRTASEGVLPERVCLIDTPDTDSMAMHRHAAALGQAVAHADVLICVFDAENPKRRDHADFLTPVIRRFDGQSLVAVLNKCDRLDEGSSNEAFCRISATISSPPGRASWIRSCACRPGGTSRTRGGTLRRAPATTSTSSKNCAPWSSSA